MSILKVSCVIVVSGLFMFGGTFAYFEHRFFCQLEGNSITVSLHEGDVYCFNYITGVSSKINAIQEDLDVSTRYINMGRDVEYREKINQRLTDEKNDYTKSRDQLLLAMDDYETELFIRVKTITYVYLKPEREAIEKKLEQADTLLMYIKLAGNMEQYNLVIQKHDELYRQRLLLDAIRSAKRFEDLIFPLKTYLQESVIE